MGVRIPRDDGWQPFKRTRLVLVRRSPWTAKPVQGLILDWRLTGTRWSALVVYVADEGPWCRSVTEWVDPKRLTPIRVDPNVVNAGRDPRDTRI